MPVLDATAIGVSIFRNDIETAGSVMFLLWHRRTLRGVDTQKSVDDLARTMLFKCRKSVVKTRESGSACTSF